MTRNRVVSQPAAPSTTSRRRAAPSTPPELEGVTPGGTHYFYYENDPGFGYIGGIRYPMSYIYGLAAHTPTGAATQPTATPVEIQAAALGEKIAVIYGQDRVGGDIFFGPWVGGYTGSPGMLTVGFGLGEGEIDSIVKVETSTVDPLTGVQTLVATPVSSSFFGFGSAASFHFYPGVDAPAAFDTAFFNVSDAYGHSFDERYPGLAYVSALLIFDPFMLKAFPDLLWTVKGRKLLDPRLGVDGSGIPNQPAVWSDNPMLCLADYFTNPYYGMGTPLAGIDWVSVAAIATWCDAIQSDGRKRFTFNSTLRREASDKANVDFIRSHFRCTYARLNGKVKFYVDQPAAHVKVFDENDHAITYATNAVPIVLTVPGHNRLTGDSVLVAGVTGNTAANGRWPVTVIDANTLSLAGSSGNGTYIDGGAIRGNCRPLHRWHTPSEQIPNRIDYQWTDPSRNYQQAIATDATAAAQAGLVYLRKAPYNADGCRNAGQGQSQATYLLKKRGKDLNHSIICSRAEGLAMEMYDVCVLNLPSFGITGYFARIVRLTKLPTGEFGFDFEEYDSAIYGELIVGTQSTPTILLPNPSAVPPTPAAPVLTQQGFDVRVDFSAPSPAYPYYAGQKITVQPAGGLEYVLGPLVTAGPLYIRGVTMGTLYTVRSYVVSIAGLLSLVASATITPTMAQVPPEVINLNAAVASISAATPLGSASVTFDAPVVRSATLYGAASLTAVNLGSYVAANVNDGNTGVTCFDFNVSGASSLVFDFGSAKVIREFWLSMSARGPSTNDPWVEYSDDNVTWTPNVAGGGNPQTAWVDGSGIITDIVFIPASAGSHRYWRIRKTSSVAEATTFTEVWPREYGAITTDVDHYNVYGFKQLSATVAAAITSIGVNTVTPSSMLGIAVDSHLALSDGRTAVVTAITSTTFTAYFFATIPASWSFTVNVRKFFNNIPFGSEPTTITPWDVNPLATHVPSSWPPPWAVAGSNSIDCVVTSVSKNGVESRGVEINNGNNFAAVGTGPYLDQLTLQGPDVASAATTSIGASAGLNVNVTGTTTITGLGAATAGVIRIVTFTGALTLTYNATSLILPGAANISTTPGDVGIFESLGSGNWKCLFYQFSPTLLNVLANGNVGLGTNNPQSQFHLLKSSVDAGGKIQLENPTATGTFPYGVVEQFGTNAFGVGSWPNAFVIEGAANGGLVLSAYGTAGLIIQTGTSRLNRLKIDTAGRITLNGTTPTPAIVSGFGTTGATITALTGSSDCSGIIEISATTGASSVGVARVTFSAALGTNTPTVVITPIDATGSWDNNVTWKLVNSTPTTLKFEVQFAQTNIFVNGKTYQFSYHVFGE